MYAVVDILGSQFKVQEGDRIRVPHLEAEPKTKVTFDKVLLFKQEGEALIGSPYLPGVTVKACVLRQYRDDKIIVFKMKRRKSSRKKNGHRQSYTDLQIDNILLDTTSTTE